MALHLVATDRDHDRDGLSALVDAEGSAAHPHLRRLCEADRRGMADRRGSDRGDRRSAAPELAQSDLSMARRVDLADAVHALCAIHGAHRGLADEAREHPAIGTAAGWLDHVAAALATERGYLARTVSAAGPLPSTPGQAATDAAFVTQRHAFHMLARSDRRGVALGAAAALALDWTAIRSVIGRAAEAYGLVLPAPTLPLTDETLTALSGVSDGASVERALLFGARALLDQHRTLWSLLEARAHARRG